MREAERHLRKAVLRVVHRLPAFSRLLPTSSQTRGNEGFESQKRTGLAKVNAPYSMRMIRHLALNLLKCESTKITVRKKRILAASDDGFRDNTLIEQ